MEKYGAEKFAHIQEVYSLFDKDNDGAIATRDVITVLRSLGYNPAEKEVKQLLIEFDPEGEGIIEFPSFLTLMDKVKQEKDLEADMDEAFRTFDQTGSGIISSVEFRTLLTQLGEKMTEEEADDFLQYADGQGRGEINWRDLLKELLKG